MRALRIARAGAPLALEEVLRPEPVPGELCLRVAACGVCRTDLHLLDGALAGAAEPITPAHRIVGRAAHLAIQVARHRGQRVFAFTRPDDRDAQRFARELGAEWAGPSDGAPPEPLDAAIVFAPVGALVPAALRAVDKGGAVICGGIHM